MRWLVLVLLFSCATPKDKNSIGTVDFSSNNPQIEINSDERLDSSGESLSATEEKVPIIELNLYPSIYQSLAVVKLLKDLERKKIKVSVINSTGFGLIISLLYAKNKNTSYLEWKLFELTKKLGALEAYSEEWIQIVNEFVKEEFENKKLNHLASLVGYFKNEVKSIKVESDGKITTAVKESINLKSDQVVFSKLSPSMVNSSNSAVDFRLSVLFLPKNPKFKSLRALNWGVYTSYLGRMLQEKDEITIFEKEKSEYLDEISPINRIQQGYEDQIDTFVKDLAEKIDIWQKEIKEN